MSENTKIIDIKNEGTSEVILTGPHNGWVVPDEFIVDGNPLGVESYWFDPKAQNRRHEACDWGMQDLFDAMQAKRSDICYASATISRLIVDLNRIPSVMVYESSSETGEPVDGNMHLSQDEKDKREIQYYAPYHTEIDRLIRETKEKFGKIIWLDMHSFTPIWQGEPRHVGVGTLKMEKNNFTLSVEKHLEDTFGELYVADHPYDLSLSPFREINAGGVVAERNNVDYFGVEIRNDLLSTTKQIETMAENMISIIDKLR